MNPLATQIASDLTHKGYLLQHKYSFAERTIRKTLAKVCDARLRRARLTFVCNTV